jgi:hypothetical protein
MLGLFAWVKSAGSVLVLWAGYPAYYGDVITCLCCMVNAYWTSFLHGVYALMCELLHFVGCLRSYGEVTLP